jgi:hypothetical protein
MILPTCARGSSSAGAHPLATPGSQLALNLFQVCVNNTPQAALAEPPTSRWEIAVWILRSVVIATAFALFTIGDIPYAVFGVTAAALAFVPAMLARSGRARIPAELELPLLWLIVADLTIGRLGGLYELLPWYDKALHFSDAFLIAMMAFVMVYLLHFIGHSHQHPWIDAIIILLITLGLGAVWEIGEYIVDGLLGRATQGSPQMAPLDDTMFDLLLDGIGGLLAAITGPIYMRHSERSRQRMQAFAELMRTKDERVAQAQADRRERQAR